MPYIKQERRCAEGAFQTNDALDQWFSELGNMENGLCAGDLNYILSMVIHKYTMKKGLSYQTASEVNAAMHGAYHEYERNVIDPYEDKKKEENGSVSIMDCND